MRVIFMGSPIFSLPTLRALREAGHDIALVVSRPDRPFGRARRPTPPPVAAFALTQGLELYQPRNLRAESALAPIREAAPELIVVAAFGLLLPPALLDLAPHGCLNVHPSLLPRFRGASPIQAAILAGDNETGVSIIQLTELMDAGPILGQIRTAIGVDEDAQTLEARLAELGARLLLDCLEPWVRGELEARAQNEDEATYCPRLERANAELHWSQPAGELARVVRAFRGRTDAFTRWEGRLLKVLAAQAIPVDAELPPPGVVFEPMPRLRPRRPLVATGEGALLLREVAIEGRPPRSGEAFLNGYPRFVGARLGS
jgi:methionyl-tRNA formyltransferase